MGLSLLFGASAQSLDPCKTCADPRDGQIDCITGQRVGLNLNPRGKEDPVSTGAIIAIVLGVLILLVLLAVLVPRMRGRRRQHQLENRRGELASQHRQAATEQATRARQAESEAKRAEAEAELHEARADLHDHGMADEEIDGRRDGRTDADAIEDRPARRA
jgi:hypothetical protein